jgi:uncharacterized protein (DUF983 family)
VSVPAGASEPPRTARMLWRGLVRRCPRCGSGGLFPRGYLGLAERCPRCGFRFEREEGFFLGAYVVNFGVCEGLVAALLFVYIGLLAGHPETSRWPFVAVGLLVGVLGPVLFYPVAQTLWTAIHLSLHPLDAKEADDAALHATPPGYIP